MARMPTLAVLAFAALGCNALSGIGDYSVGTIVGEHPDGVVDDGQALDAETTIEDVAVDGVLDADPDAPDTAIDAAETAAGRADGEVCSASGDCASSRCVDGYCCDSACGGQCEACDATKGKCVAVSGAPHGSRAACSGTGAGTTCGDRCDGVDATKCSYPSSSTTCGANACAGGVETHFALCDGAGKCKDVPKSCAPYTCDATTCKTSCTTGSPDCVSPFYCKSGACVPP